MRMFNRFVQGAILVIATIIAAKSANAVSFSDASLKGSYSFLINLRTANTSTNQFAMVGVLTFDGAGNVSGSYTSISADTPSSGTLGGTYTVASNGTGTLTFTSGSSAEFEIALNSPVKDIAENVQLLQINDSNNEIISGTAVLQSTTTETYSAASLKGSFTFQYNPWTAESSLSQDGGIGVFTFNGKGSVAFSVTTVYGGTVFTNSGSMTYTVNSNGTGTISATGGNSLQIAFALNSLSGKLVKGLQFLDTDTTDGGNMVITGTAVEQ